MDEIEDFFNVSKNYQFNQESVASTSSRVQTKRSRANQDSNLEQKKPKINDNLVGISNKDPEVEKFSLENVEFYEDDACQTGNTDDVYDRYIFNLNRDDTLPINDYKDEILKTIRKHPVVILEGDTGCGKTTQVPQYILDDAYRRREYCNIVCTQPRRIAAISISKRVSTERKWEQGSVVGYQVGLHASKSDDTRLLYCTTGVLLQKLIKEKNLFPFTHLILDEIHERGKETDLLLVIVRRLLVTTSRKVKIILMSATMDTSEVSNYFTLCNNPAPVIRVNTRHLYQIKEFYLCDLKRINAENVEVNYERPCISPDMYKLVVKLVLVIHNIEKDELNPNLEKNLHSNGISILVFLPGINEINEMYRVLEKLNEYQRNEIQLQLIRLHSLIPTEEQNKIFERTPFGYRKVILATNIAESSITVPDVKYVIDFCLTRILITNTSTNFSTLKLHWATRANCRQRAGRAGRVMNGSVYRLVPRHFYENYLAEYSIPEILRCPLENVVLQAKLLDIGSPSSVLAMCMTPPNINRIQYTITMLKEIGALYKCVKDNYIKDDGDISFMGRVMAVMPLDVRLTRLILLGYTFNVLEDSIIIAAGLSVGTIFKIPPSKYQNAIKAFMQKLNWAQGSGSDLIAILMAYREWASLDITKTNEDEWAQQNFINLRLVKEMQLLVLELKERLNYFNIESKPIYYGLRSLDWEKNIILKVVIAGAFYPNYFVRSKVADLEKERAIYYDLCCNDPCNTVVFTNFDPCQIGALYVRSIKDLFTQVGIEPNCIDVRFQSNSERIYIVFKDNNTFSHVDNNDGEGNDENSTLIPGNVHLNVYKALRMRLLKMKTTIAVMNFSASIKYAEKHGLGNMCGSVWKPTKPLINNIELVVLPTVYEKYIKGYITHIETCSKFFFQPICEVNRLRDIHELINNSAEIKKCRFSSPANIKNGMMLIAKFENKFYRAQVLKIIRISHQNIKYKVYFIDFGNVSIVDFDDLRYYYSHCQHLKDIPPRIFPCRLALIEPSSIMSPTEQWVDEAMEYLQKHADSGVVQIEVYSVALGVSNVIIKEGDNTINEMLVEKGWARTSDENYLSKMNHDLRLRKQTAVARSLEDDQIELNEANLLTLPSESNVDIEPPPKQLCKNVINLRGPFSPIESELFSAIKVGNWKKVQTEVDSVNYVLLDTNPKDVYQRLVVAAQIQEIHNGNRLIMRGTTLMPNIHGFAALMALLFAPYTQIKVNDKQSKYMAFISGLGYDENTMEALYSEHDIALNLDFDLLSDDIGLINQIRYAMDVLLFTEPNDETPQIRPREVDELMASIKTLTLRLLSKNRKYIEIDPVYNDGEWRHYSSEEMVELNDVRGKRTLFPQISYKRLYDEKFEYIHALTKQCTEMYKLRQFDSSIQPLNCRLCNQQIENVGQLRLHLLTQQHRDREQQIHFKPPV